MLDIQKKIILASVVEMLTKEKASCTRTSLKRYVEFDDNDVLESIEYGIQTGVLRPEPSGYIKLLKQEYRIQEEDYYDQIKSMLGKYYNSRVSRSGDCLVAKTARKDTKIAGRWTRPDFTVVASRTFPYIRQVEFDIITFEVKRPEDCDTLAVFEALAHNSAATRSYVFFPMTEEEFEENAQSERIREECIHHGIGLVLTNDGFTLDEIVVLIESRRRALNPEKCSQFLRNVLESRELSVLTTWRQ